MPLSVRNKRGWITILVLLILADPWPLAWGQMIDATSKALPDSIEPAEPQPVASIKRGEDAAQPFLGGISLLFDNDVFAGSDDRYTTGLALAWTSAEADRYGEKSLQRRILKALSSLETVFLRCGLFKETASMSTELHTDIVTTQLGATPMKEECT